MLTAIVFLPAVGAIVMVLLAKNDRQVRFLSLLITLTVLVLVLVVWATIDLDDPNPQWVQRYQWISAFDVQYYLGVDGLSAPLLGLTGLLGVAAVLISWSIKHRTREFFFWLLILQTGITGVFVALDLLLFFMFWEVELVPMFLLISIWGSGRREYSAMKFLLYTMLSSGLMLAGMLVLYFSAGTFDMIALRDAPPSIALITAPGVFFLLLAAFAVKLPVWPFHTWLPDAHTDAPTAASVMLAGVMLKMGGYGLLRINVGMFPSQTDRFAWALVALGVISVLYGAVVTMRQTDLKRLIAFSSISHMGLVLLGIGS
ncbi:MAG: NADH-quinone oxidoreductase subunit M, partial [Chloroflexi bacterium]|nr:NADH-quinone oxidoreductase subunit M [Chloroflexota bacterium]